MKKIIHISETDAVTQLARTISYSIPKGFNEKIPLLCIGTDTSTGDSYGLITATRMYHLCHVFYQQLPRNLPLAVNVFTNRKTPRIF
ncbi:DUF1256 domain-containing protein [Alkalihalobacillus deserti]|uniref:DUF1256 domain-containing protein n=1 Tax=Alkalihalobacillus deserti TaxID=2879466 RepID=UPI001D15CEF9|nr:DUF1256 domain-containing protein [Alkalihalobacillus deserti]